MYACFDLSILAYWVSFSSFLLCTLNSAIDCYHSSFILDLLQSRGQVHLVFFFLHFCFYLWSFRLVQATKKPFKKWLNYLKLRNKRFELKEKEYQLYCSPLVRHLFLHCNAIKQACYQIDSFSLSLISHVQAKINKSSR